MWQADFVAMLRAKSRIRRKVVMVEVCTTPVDFSVGSSLPLIASGTLFSFFRVVQRENEFSLLAELRYPLGTEGVVNNLDGKLVKILPPRNKWTIIHAKILWKDTCTIPKFYEAEVPIITPHRIG
jgi:hypothetical protein